MKRGIKFMPLPNPPVEPSAYRELPPGSEIDGIPVLFNPFTNEVAEARGFWPLKRIMVGPRWFLLDRDQQMAVIMHELGHCRRLHFEARLFLLPLCWTKIVRRIAWEQEFSADRRAVEEGFGPALVAFLRRHGAQHNGPYYPPIAERILRITEHNMTRQFLRLGIGASVASITGTRQALGYQQILNATLAAATGLTIPTPPRGSVVGYVVVQSNGGVVRWRDDGTDPTSSVGMVIPSGGELHYTGDFSKIKFIASSGTPILDISYYA